MLTSIKLSDQCGFSVMLDLLRYGDISLIIVLAHRPPNLFVRIYYMTASLLTLFVLPT